MAKSTAGIKSIDSANPQIEVTEQAHQARSVAKPGAAVSLKNVEPFYAAAPGVQDYQLRLLSSEPTGTMTVEASTNDDLEILSSARRFEFELRENGEYVLPLTISASAEGRFYIQLHISINSNGQSSSRVIAAILQVGEPAIKAQKTVRSAAQEMEKVISLPAQETISPR